MIELLKIKLIVSGKKKRMKVNDRYSKAEIDRQKKEKLLKAKERAEVHKIDLSKKEEKVDESK
jgi:hypothetical protein